MIWTFREDPRPDGGIADSRRTLFFVRCAGGDPPDLAQDTAHVSGTPAAAPEHMPPPSENP